MSTRDVLERCKASLRAGAIGDGLGAPVEVMKLSAILAEFPQGVEKFAHYDPGDYLQAAPCGQTGQGVVTDDTCMTMATLAGLYSAWTGSAWAGGDLIGSIHQAYLHWARHQAWATADYESLVDQTVKFPPWLQKFCFSSGAGKGTVAALDSGTTGSVAEPLLIRDRKTGKPTGNQGSGGMMRIAPVGWMGAVGLVSNPYRTACEVAAITHGGEIAQATSGAVAVLICELARGNTWDGAVFRLKEVLNAQLRDPDDDRDQSAPAVILTWVVQIRRDNRRLGQPGVDPYTSQHDEPFRSVSHTPADMLRRGANLFLANAIFIQAFMICHAAQHWHGTPEERLRWALTLAVTQNGDSDTVGAIVGNIMGAQLGPEAVNPLYNGNLQPISRPDLEEAAVSLDKMAGELTDPRAS